jgi:hypothetical protein
MRLFNDSLDFRFVSVRFWPSCVEGMQLLGALRFCRRVYLVSENVVGLSPGDGEIQAGQQLCQRFTFSAFQHGQCVSPLVGHSDTFRERRNDSDADSAVCDCLFDVGQLWETACGNVRGGVFAYAASWLGSCRLAATFQGSNSSMRLIG